MQKLFEDNKCNEKPIISSLQEKCDYENSIKGNLCYYDCEKCLNRGFINVIINDSIYAKKCSCLIILWQEHTRLNLHSCCETIL